jgi:prolyl-tRNA synthetase
MRALVAGPDGQERAIHGGSYGIGVSRLTGAVIEASHDEAGIIWPEPVAPFGVAILNLKPGDSGADAGAEKAYKALQPREPLYDDTDARPGAGPKGLEKGVVEVKERCSGVREELPLDAALKKLSAKR